MWFYCRCIAKKKKSNKKERNARLAGVPMIKVADIFAARFPEMIPKTSDFSDSRGAASVSSSNETNVRDADHYCS